jgi:CO dehydrogenase maturation factor
MSKLIAVSGKGGVGKTTISALLISRLIAKNCSPVLAIDADPNTCLDSALGVKVERTVGRIREEAKKIAGKGLSAGISKQELLELKIAECLVESKDFDLIAMGRSEGHGCYCYANNVLKAVINEITSQYPYVVLDNEAGLENLSRRIVQKVDALILVADPSKQGISTIKRLYELSREMEIESSKLVIIINRLRREDIPESVLSLKEELGAETAIGIPDNDEIALYNEEGKSLLTIPVDNPAVKKIDNLIGILEL